MKLFFLGTGAADFLPSLNDKDRFTIDKNIRRCTMTLLDDSTLIDCGPHLMDAIRIHGIAAEKIQNVLITHSHGDHFKAESLQALAASTGKVLHIWYPEELNLQGLDTFELHPMRIGEAYSVGALQVTPLRANHAAGAVHYSIAAGEKSLFYGCDGAWLLLDTYNYMKKKNYDLMILDATVGDYEGDFRMAEHNSIPMIRSMLKSFHTVEIATEKTKIVLDHLARTLHKPYEETCKIVEQDGFVVAYDGMTMEL